MKILKLDSEVHKKVEMIFNLMDELGIDIDYMAGEFRITDKTKEGHEYGTNLVLIDSEDSSAVPSIPPSCEYRLKVFNS